MSIAKLKIIPLIAILALPVILSGCGNGGSPAGSIDMQMDQSGIHRTADTQRNWEGWKSAADADIAREAEGMSVANGYGTWRNFWSNRMQALKKSQVNPDKYISYIISARNTHNLPKL